MFFPKIYRVYLRLVAISKKVIKCYNFLGRQEKYTYYCLTNVMMAFSLRVLELCFPIFDGLCALLLMTQIQWFGPVKTRLLVPFLHI